MLNDKPNRKKKCWMTINHIKYFQHWKELFLCTSYWHSCKPANSPCPTERTPHFGFILPILLSSHFWQIFKHSLARLLFSNILKLLLAFRLPLCTPECLFKGCLVIWYMPQWSIKNNRLCSDMDIQQDNNPFYLLPPLSNQNNWLPSILCDMCPVEKLLFCIMSILLI